MKHPLTPLIGTLETAGIFNLSTRRFDITEFVAPVSHTPLHLYAFCPPPTKGFQQKHYQTSDTPIIRQSLITKYCSS